MNEEGRLRNILSLSNLSDREPLDEAAAAVAISGGSTQWKGKSSKSTPSKDLSKVTCHKCGGVGHYRSNCPTHDSDGIANAAEEDETEETAFTAVVNEDEDEGFW
jgi:hypothetical protein